MRRRSLTIVLTALALAPVTLAQSPFPRHNVDLGQSSSDFVAGDVNGDGAVDLLAGAAFGAALFLNQGGGDFGYDPGDFIDLPDVGGTAALQLADLDGDHDLDALAVLSVSAVIYTWANDGAGNMTMIDLEDTQATPADIECMDLDGDGDLDVAVPGRQSNRVRVFHNDGTGDLTFVEDLVTGDYARSVALGDLDGDGDADMVVGNQHAGSLSVYANEGDGTFGPHQLFDGGPSPFHVKLVDATGDGVLDVLLGNGDISDDRISIVPGLGDGRLDTPIEVHVGGGYPLDPWLVDMDEDQVPDIVVPAALDDGIYVLKGLGSGSYAAGVYHPTSDNPQRIAVADVSEDGDLDVVVANLNSDVLTVLLGHGDLSLAPNYRVNDEPRDLAAGDLDGDGWLDLVATSDGTPTVAVLMGRGAGHFGGAAVFPAGTSTEEVELGDFDGDGSLDALVGHGNSDLSLLAGGGDGTLGAPTPAVFNAGGVLGFQSTELDGDGALDLVLVGGGTKVLLGNGDGSFGAASVVVAGAVDAATVGDVDNDGELDLVSQLDATVVFSGGVGDGSFDREVVSPTGVTFGYGLTLADFDEDGFLDVAQIGSGSVSTIGFGAGDGTFADEITVPEFAGTAGTIAAADFDADGHLDLVTGGTWWGTTSGSITFHAGNGDGTFGDAVWLVQGSSPRRGTVADLDRDGVPDLAWSVADAFGTATDAEHVAVMLSRAGPWTNLGDPLPGTHGTPTFVSTGPLTAGSPIEHHVDDGLHGGTAWFVIGLSSLGLPFKKGVLHPSPDLLIPLPLDGIGHVEIVDVWPSGLPSGAGIVYQWWIPDPAGPKGFSATNGLGALTP